MSSTARSRVGNGSKVTDDGIQQCQRRIPDQRCGNRWQSRARSTATSELIGWIAMHPVATSSSRSPTTGGWNRNNRNRKPRVVIGPGSIVEWPERSGLEKRGRTLFISEIGPKSVVCSGAMMSIGRRRFASAGDLTVEATPIWRVRHSPAYRSLESARSTGLIGLQCRGESAMITTTGPFQPRPSARDPMDGLAVRESGRSPAFVDQGVSARPRRGRRPASGTRAS